MLKYTSLLWAVLIVSSWLGEVSARSATTAQYQQTNGIDSAGQAAKLPENAVDSAANPATLDSTASQNVWRDLSMVYKIYQQCASKDLSVCLKVKLLTGLERIIRSAKTLKILDGVQFLHSSDDGISGQAKLPLPSENDIEATLPRTSDAKDLVLSNMIFKKIAAFLQDYTLQIKFPDVRDEDGYASNSVESRKKKDKKGGGAFIMIPLLLGGTFIPIAYGALAMLAGKALIVSKLALVLASIIGIKKLLSGGGKESSHEVVVSSGSHSGWGRDIDLAYSGWKPAAKNAAKNI